VSMPIARSLAVAGACVLAVAPLGSLHAQRRARFGPIVSSIALEDAGGASRELARTLSLLDKSIGTGIIHRNTAARHKSRLTRQVNALQAVR